jgi:hypothetical protein
MRQSELCRFSVELLGATRHVPTNDMHWRSIAGACYHQKHQSSNEATYRVGVCHIICKCRNNTQDIFREKK